MLCPTDNAGNWFRAAKFILWGWLAVGLLLSAAAQSVVLTWNPSLDANRAGYKIYYGAASRAYTNAVTVGNVTNATLSGLAAGATYYFSATTYDAAGNESDFSNEASYAVPAAVEPTPTNPPVIAPTNPPVLGNQPPTLNPIANLTISQNADTQTVALAGITSGAANETQSLQVTAKCSNPALIPKLTVNYLSPNLAGTLAFKPAGNSSGLAVITVMVNDGARSNNIVTRSFLVTVLASVQNMAGKTSGASAVSSAAISAQITVAPAISPVTNRVVMAGATVSLNATATGTGPFQYQWRLNGVPLAAATGAALTIRNVQASQAGDYSVTVSNGTGATNSVSVQLAVFATPAATLTAAVHSPGQFGFLVSGVTGYRYVVQTSPDLVKWTSVQTNSAPFTFQDNNAGAVSRRFYRTYYLP